MSNLILKQVCGGNDIVINVAPNSRIMRDDLQDTVDVYWGNQLVQSLNLSDGVIYLMNDQGKTIDTFRTKRKSPEKLTPVKHNEETTSITGGDAVVFSLANYRFVTLQNDITYAFAADAGTIKPLGDVSKSMVKVFAVNKWQILKAVTCMNDVFKVDQMDYALEGEFKKCDFVLMPADANMDHRAINKLRAISVEEELKLFGRARMLTKDVKARVGDNCYTANEYGQVVKL